MTEAVAGAHVALRVVVPWTSLHPAAAGPAVDQPRQQVLRRRSDVRVALRVQQHGPNLVSDLAVHAGHGPDDPRRESPVRRCEVVVAARDDGQADSGAFDQVDERFEFSR